MPKPRLVRPVGARVRHGGEQYSAASNLGTAVITGHDWHGDHLEYLVTRDKPWYPGGATDTTWASYHTYLAETQPAEIQVLLDLIEAGRQ